MRNMIAIVAMAFLVGCQQQPWDYIDQLNSAPKINLSNNPDVAAVLDSMKTNQFFTSRYQIDVNVIDENNNIRGLDYELLSGIGDLYFEGRRIGNSEVAIYNDALQLHYNPRGFGNHQLRIIIIDDFGASSSTTVSLDVFENLSPRAVLSFDKIGKESPYEYEFIATESYDLDAAFGGEIRAYEFTFQNNRIEREEPRLRHIFPGIIEGSTNIYEVVLRVKDNDNTWSEPVNVLIDLTK